MMFYTNSDNQGIIHPAHQVERFVTIEFYRSKKLIFGFWDGQNKLFEDGRYVSLFTPLLWCNELIVDYLTTTTSLCFPAVNY